jgi:topoisomerase-4 subunit A
MAYVKKLFNDNFLYYASYVIKDRAIPDVEDGLKPVQRRILHSLFEMDDGKFHKVANVVGHCMKYHPHGDASIYSALVVLANKELFIDRQGNFGNLFTGDEASAARYIECRALPMAKDVFYNPKLTEYQESYDGRNKEPVAFPAKLPVPLIIGAEGIAVGMSTTILPHNALEVIKAEIACLSGKRFKLYPDFPTGGVCDVSEYADGKGKVRVRAKFDLSDPKRIVVRELPFGVTTESLIESVEKASRLGRIKIAGISDFTTEHVEIEIRLPRGVYAEELVDALYAFTKCEQSISCNLLLIKDGTPTVMAVSEVVQHHAKNLLGILKRELELEARELLDELHARTLERIFIEERVYKAIEKMKTQEGVIKAVFDGLKPFAAEIKREVTAVDVERLLKIPIRRISLYDINRAKEEMEKIKARLKEIKKHLGALVDYAIAFLEGLSKKLAHHKRKTEIAGFERVDAKEVVRRDIALRYDRSSGYLGTAVSTGESLFTASPYDKILVFRRNGLYSVVPLPEKLFVDRDMLYCAIAEKEAISSLEMSVFYKDGEHGFPHIKKFRVEGWIMNKDYPAVPDGATVLFFTVDPNASVRVIYKPKERQKVKDEVFSVRDFDVKGLKANGIRLAPREVEEVVEHALELEGKKRKGSK